MSFTTIKIFNSGYCTLIEVNGEYYAYENGKFNGVYYKGWHCDKYGNQLENDKRDYKIKPIYRGIGELEDYTYAEYELVDVEIEYL